MDANMRRLPDEFVTLSKFLVPLAGLLWHPPPADSADIPSKQAERQSTTSKMQCLRTMTFPVTKGTPPMTATIDLFWFGLF